MSAFEVSFGSDVFWPVLPSGQLFASLDHWAALSAQLLQKAAGLFRLKLLRLSPLARGVVGPVVSKRRSTSVRLLQAWAAAAGVVPVTLKQMALRNADSAEGKASDATHHKVSCSAPCATAFQTCVVCSEFEDWYLQLSR